jgi:NAD(P)-dependent dehydrogenase (short-subunit alcohol dehydrogenase family)
MKIYFPRYTRQSPIKMAQIIDTVKSTLAENFGGTSVTPPIVFPSSTILTTIRHSLASPSHQFALQDVPDLSQKVGVITGGSNGIGYGCAHTLLSNNISKLFIISRSQEIIDSSLDSISKEISPEAAQKITWLKCDIGDWKAVAKTAKTISEQTDRVDILINNAARGVMTYQLTEDGVDRHMAVNHIGHVVLTSHLTPLMKSTAEKGNVVRIVMLGSNAHQAAPSDVKFSSLEELNQDLGPNGQYGRSKLAQMLYAKYLAKHLTSQYPKILANSVHPGFVDTKMSREDIHEPYPVAGYAMSVGMKPFKKSIWDGCVSAVFCATKTEGSGEYVCPPAIPEKGSAVYEDKEGRLAERLMELTRAVVAEKTRNESVERGCPIKFC